MATNSVLTSSLAAQRTQAAAGTFAAPLSLFASDSFFIAAKTVAEALGEMGLSKLVEPLAQLGFDRVVLYSFDFFVFAAYLIQCVCRVTLCT